jgi:hypothetical protein
MTYQQGDRWLVSAFKERRINATQFALVVELRSTFWKYGEEAIWLSQAAIAAKAGKSRIVLGRNIKVLRRLGVLKMVADPRQQKWGLVFNPEVVTMGDPATRRKQEELWLRTVDPLSPGEVVGERLSGQGGEADRLGGVEQQRGGPHGGAQGLPVNCPGAATVGAQWGGGAGEACGAGAAA